MAAERLQHIIDALLTPGFYDHPAEDVEMLETHISLVFLAGDFAYKVKKPVDFGFLDFSTLDKRRFYCEEEVRLNRRFAPGLYLAAIQIGGRSEAPVLGAEPPLEYAVKMRRFPQQCQCDRLLAKGQLRRNQLDAFAARIAQLHGQAARADRSQPYGEPQAVLEPMLENFRQIRQNAPGQSDSVSLSALEEWTRGQHALLSPLLRQRHEQGAIRECHGDLHLANMAWFENQPLLFDCIEFNPNLRWIDLLNDIAFLVMDLDDRGHAALGWRFLNRYLQETGDYQGLRVLNLYKTYRAMVRAKVNSLRLAQEGLSDEERKQDLALYQSYLDLATSYTVSSPGLLLITHGVSGTGKSSFAAELAELCGLLHLQSDRERKRLHGLAAEAPSHSPLDGGIYSHAAGAATYHRLLHLAKTILEAGHAVLVDATFLDKDHRGRFLKLANGLQVKAMVLDFDVPEAELRQRIRRRMKNGGGVSEAGLDVLDAQLERQQPLSKEEQNIALRIGTTTRPEEIAERLARNEG